MSSGTRTSPHKKERGEVVRALKSFARIWNDGLGFPNYYDLERALDIPFKGIIKKARTYQGIAHTYPEYGLPALVLRNNSDGRVIPVPRDVLESLEPFRIDPSELKNARGFVATAAQFGAPLNTHVWKALQHYVDYRGYVVVVLPIKYGRIKKHKQKITATFPDALKGRVLFEGYTLRRHELTLNPMRLRPTLETFLTPRVQQTGGALSQVFAAPRFELLHLPRIGRKYPKAVMTTGAVTHPTYVVDTLGQQDRTGELATEEHAFGAVVIELAEHGTFHFRQLVANKRGEFYDVDKDHGAVLFSPEGHQPSPHSVEALICGDWHTGKTDPTVRNVTFEDEHGIVQTLHPKHVVLHDFIDCDSVSKWEEKQATRRGFKGPVGWDSLYDELRAGIDELAWMQARYAGTLHVVASNHNEYVAEFIESLRWTKDNANLYIGAMLYKVMVDDLRTRHGSLAKHEARAIDPVVWWFRTHAPFVRAHERQDSLLLPKRKKNASLLSMHGDKGPGGKETRSTKAFRAMNINVVLGHNHSATITGPVWRVGTSTPRMQFYVEQPSTNWTNTHCVIFENGQRQLINIVNGCWHGM